MSDFMKIVSSQYKHLPGRSIDYIDTRTIKKASALMNEPYSFQVLYKCPVSHMPLAVNISVETELPVASYKVDYVPIMNVMNINNDNKGFESNNAGLFPDILMPRSADCEIYER